MAGHELPHGDFEVLPAGPWQYGIAAGSIEHPEQIEWQESPLGTQPFSPDGAPASARINAIPVAWHQENGSATPEPASRTATGPTQSLRLIPYGCTNLRLTEWPLLDDPDSAMKSD